DSAWFHINRASVIYKKETNHKAVSKYATTGVRPQTLLLLSVQIETTAFNKADSANTIKAWEFFIKKFNGAARMNTAIEKRNDIAFSQAKENFTYQSFKEFMQKYPNASQLPEAQNLYESLLYKTLTQAHTSKAFKLFIDKYPNSPYIDDAQEN